MSVTVSPPVWVPKHYEKLCDAITKEIIWYVVNYTILGGIPITINVDENQIPLIVYEIIKAAYKSTDEDPTVRKRLADILRVMQTNSGVVRELCELVNSSQNPQPKSLDKITTSHINEHNSVLIRFMIEHRLLPELGRIVIRKCPEWIEIVQCVLTYTNVWEIVFDHIDFQGITFENIKRIQSIGFIKCSKYAEAYGRLDKENLKKINIVGNSYGVALPLESCVLEDLTIIYGTLLPDTFPNCYPRLRRLTYFSENPIPGTQTDIDKLPLNYIHMRCPNAHEYLANHIKKLRPGKCRVEKP